MNIVERASDTIQKQITELEGLTRLRTSRTDFFTAFDAFAGRLARELARSCVFNASDKATVASLVEKIGLNRTKSQYPNAVYWPGVSPAINELCALLRELGACLDKRRVPVLDQVTDFSRRHAGTIITIVVGILAIIVSIKYAR